MEFFRDLFKTDFMPHGHCYFWRPEVLWTNVIGDGIIVLAYYTIPFLLYYFARRRKDIKRISPVLILFALFIFGCGTTHVLSIISVWTPVYRLDGLMKLLTGAVSIYTAYTVVRLIPVALRIPSLDEITETNRQLSEVNVELKTKSNDLLAQNEFLGKLAFATHHDLREPVRVMSMNSQILIQRYGNQIDSDGLKMLHEIDQEGKRMYNSADSILKYTFLESEQYMSENVSLRQVLAKVNTMLKELVNSSQATINISELPDIKGNESLLLLLFENVISNSIHFRGAEPPVINVAATRHGSDCIIKISDNGAGFDPKYKEKVFDMFQRLGNSITYRGAGLGLALCRRIAQIQHGSIYADSMEGVGTIITITLPLGSPVSTVQN